jgi:hypothetical protein
MSANQDRYAAGVHSARVATPALNSTSTKAAVKGNRRASAVRCDAMRCGGVRCSARRADRPAGGAGLDVGHPTVRRGTRLAVPSNMAPHWTGWLRGTATLRPSPRADQTQGAGLIHSAPLLTQRTPLNSRGPAHRGPIWPAPVRWSAQAGTAAPIAASTASGISPPVPGKWQARTSPRQRQRHTQLLLRPQSGKSARADAGRSAGTGSTRCARRKESWVSTACSCPPRNGS